MKWPQPPCSSWAVGRAAAAGCAASWLPSKGCCSLPSAAVECAAAKTKLMNEAEARLYNEINTKHIYGAFGKETFNAGDKMVSMVVVQPSSSSADRGRRARRGTVRAAASSGSVPGGRSVTCPM